MGVRRTRGEGSVFQRSDGMWVGRVDLGLVGGKRVRRQVTAHTRRELTPKLERLKREVATGVVGSDATVKEWLTYWLENIAARKLRERTLLGYRGYCEKWIYPSIGHIKIAKLTADHVRAMHKVMRDAGKAEATVRQAHAILHRAMLVAERERKIMRSPVGDVDAPEVSVAHHAALDLEDCAKVLTGAPSLGARVRLDVAILMGLRQGEALALQWDDVDLTTNEVHVRQSLTRVKGKGLVLGKVKSAASERWVPMVADVAARMKAWREETGGQGFVFGGEKPTDPRRDWQAWKDACAAAGVPDVPLHGARASCASILDSMGYSPRLVADILGHAQVMVTQKHYARSYGDQRRAALEGMAKAIGA